TEEEAELGEDVQQPAEGFAGGTEQAERGERGEGGSRRRRRRRRRGRHGEPRENDRVMHETVAEHTVAPADDDEESGGEGEDMEEAALSGEPPGAADVEGENEQPRRRRRGRRGGRRGRRGREGEGPALENGHASMEPELADDVADFGGP